MSKKKKDDCKYIIIELLECVSRSESIYIIECVKHDLMFPKRCEDVMIDDDYSLPEHDDVNSPLYRSDFVKITIGDIKVALGGIELEISDKFDILNDVKNFLEM